MEHVKFLGQIGRSPSAWPFIKVLRTGLGLEWWINREYHSEYDRTSALTMETCVRENQRV